MLCLSLEIQNDPNDLPHERLGLLQAVGGLEQ